MYIWGYQTPVFIPNLYDWVKKTSFLVKFFHFQGTNVHLGLPNSSFYPNRLKKNFIFSEIFSIFREQMYISGYQKTVFIPIGSKKNSFLVKFFHFQGTNVHLGIPNSSFYPQFVRSGQKNLIFSEIFTFLGNKCTFGGTKLLFLSQSGQKNFIFSEIFSIFREQMYIWGYQTPVFVPNLYDQVKKNSFLVKFFHFQGTNVHLGVPNSSFYPHRVKKTSFLVKFFNFQGTNVHLGVPNSSFYPQFVR